MRWAILLVFLAVPAYGQVVEVAGGSSTLYQSSGAAVTFHFPDSTMMLSGGDSSGHLAFGFADTREWHGWDATFGDKAFSGNAGSAGLGIVVRGVSLTRHKLTIFVGATGPSYAAPYFQAATQQRFGAGLSYEREFSHGLKFNSLEVLAGHSRTAVESLEYHWRVLKLQGTGGALENAAYWNADFDLQPARWVGISGARTSYSFATVNSIGGSISAGSISFHGSAYSSGQVSGESVGAVARVGFLDLRGDYFASKYGDNITGSVGQRIGRRWTIDEFLSESAGNYSVNFGGGYTSNQLSINVGYQEFFMPLYVGRNPFQRAVAVTISFHLPHDSSATLATTIDPTGKIRYAAYGGTYLQGNLESGERQRPAIHGGFIIRGFVLDKSGMPVVGAAVEIGGQLAYSDSSGALFVREKRASAVPVHVSLDDFAAPGKWAVIDCPATATPGAPLAIIVGRR